MQSSHVPTSSRRNWLYLPDRTGAEMLQKLRAGQQTADVAFMLISSETDPQDLDLVRQAGPQFRWAKLVTPIGGAD